jgi:hypothetical protein
MRFRLTGALLSIHLMRAPRPISLPGTMHCDMAPE